MSAKPRSRGPSRPTLTSMLLDVPPRQVEEEGFDEAITGMAQDARKILRLRQLGALQVDQGGAPPAPATVQDQVAVGTALAQMATSTTHMAQNSARIAQEQANADRTRLLAEQAAADRRVAQVAETERQRGADALAVVERLMAAEREAREREATLRAALDEERRTSALQRLEDRLERLEQQHAAERAALQAQATKHENEAAALRQALGQKKSAAEEIVDAVLTSGGDVEAAPAVRLLRAIAPGPQSAVLDADGRPLDPNLRYAHGMADILVQREAKKSEMVDRGIGLLERLYEDAREFVGLEDARGTSAAPGALAAEMAAEAEGEHA